MKKIIFRNLFGFGMMSYEHHLNIRVFLSHELIQQKVEAPSEILLNRAHLIERFHRTFKTMLFKSIEAHFSNTRIVGKQTAM